MVQVSRAIRYGIKDKKVSWMALLAHTPTTVTSHVTILLYNPYYAFELVPFPPKSSAVHEVPDADQMLVIYRSALVNKISDTMKNQTSLLVTSLANLMYNN